MLSNEVEIVYRETWTSFMNGSLSTHPLLVNALHESIASLRPIYPNNNACWGRIIASILYSHFLFSVGLYYKKKSS